MKLYAFGFLVLLSLASTFARTDDNAQASGTLIRGRDGAMLAGDDGKIYDLPNIGDNILNRYEGYRVTADDSKLIIQSQPRRRIPAGYTEEVIVTAPREDDRSAGTKAAEAAGYVAPVIIPPFP